jgi:microcystin-dependent protein
MAKNKVSEWSATPADNTDVGGIDINEGCAPSGINNAIRDLMSQIKDWQSGADGEPLTVSGVADFTGEFKLDGASGTAGQVLVSAGAGNTPVWGNAFVAGMIMLWSGSIASVPSGWALCDGSSGRPDLRNRFVVGAGSTYAVNATGGTADSVVVSHTHSATVTDSGHKHFQSETINGGYGKYSGANASASTTLRYGYNPAGSPNADSNYTSTESSNITVVNSTTGSSGTNANLPPYFALAYIIKL